MGCGASHEAPHPTAAAVLAEQPPAAPAAPAPSAAAATAPVVTYEFDKLSTDNYLGLPRLPIPALEDTMKAYLKGVSALEFSAQEMAAHEKLVDEFTHGVGKELHAAVRRSILRFMRDSIGTRSCATPEHFSALICY
eukprot:1178967-Prorocentrum_minimum.AAC.2